MIKWLYRVFPWVKIRSLEQENSELKQKLVERQEAINKTNAYWKKKLREALTKNR